MSKERGLELQLNEETAVNAYNDTALLYESILKYIEKKWKMHVKTNVKGRYF